MKRQHTNVRLLILSVGFLCYIDNTILRANEDVPFAPISSPENPSFPDLWIDGIVQGKVTAVPVAYKDRAERITRELLKRYPGEVLTHTVKKIVLVGDMSFYGHSSAGTYWEYDLFIAAGCILRKYDEETLRRTLHHEISSLIKWQFDD